MPGKPSDPIESVKAFLRKNGATAQREIDEDLRAIGDRLGRGRKIERGLELSERLQALFRQANLPPA